SRLIRLLSPHRRFRGPMGEQVRLARFDPAQPAPRSLCVSPKSFVFQLCPAHDKWIYCAQCPAKRRTMKTPVIVDPANKNRPCPLGDFLQVEIVAMVQLSSDARLRA